MTIFYSIPDIMRPKYFIFCFSFTSFIYTHQFLHSFTQQIPKAIESCVCRWLQKIAVTMLWKNICAGSLHGENRFCCQSRTPHLSTSGREMISAQARSNQSSLKKWPQNEFSVEPIRTKTFFSFFWFSFLVQASNYCACFQTETFSL